MIWKVKIEDRAHKELKTLDHQVQKFILRYLASHIEETQNPKQFGKSLSYEKSGLWCYRIGDYRVICNINETQETVFVLSIGHRKDIYRKPFFIF